ncbi:MAG TPA: ABC transporter permease [Bryobacteraceae bacterium]|nr:ABC transporter permease [Bryobacteraceae bacterium]
MRFYQLLLHLYPASFRAEYGGEMAAIFARRRRDAAGIFGLATLWLGTMVETLANAAAVHADILRQDLRLAVRTLTRSRGFALTAVLVVALGVGANTAVFSLVDHVLIRPLPFADSDRLVKLWQRQPGYSHMELSPPNYRDWKNMSHSFEAMEAFTSMSHNLVGRGEPERVEGEHITTGLFPMLGAQPILGRGFSAEDERDGAPRTLVLGYTLWQAVFGGEADVIGRDVQLDDASYKVIGVMPADFHFPTREIEFWTPLRPEEMDFADRNDNYLQAIGKLRRGVSLRQARAEMAVVSTQLERRYPKENERIGANVIGLRDELSEQSRMLLGALAGASLCVLLIACTNLASLLLARGLARRRELAVRAALGAGRERLMRQLVTESLVLAALGGGLGVAASRAALPLLARLVPDTLPIAQAPALDLRILLFALAVTGITGLAFGVLPATRASRSARFDDLHEGPRSGGGQKERLRAMLVMAEVTVSVVLLVASGLLIRALWRLEAVDPGFRSEGVFTARTWLPWPRYSVTERRTAFYRRVLEEVRQLPGVKGAAYVTFLPMTMTGGIWPVLVSGDSEIRAPSRVASLRFMTPGFFAVMGIPLRLGRDISDADTIDRPFVAVVSESFVERYWPHENPIGRHFQMAFHDRRVVGVVGDIRVRGLERQSEPQVYFPHRQFPDDSFIFYAPKDLAVRSAGNPMALAGAIRRIVQKADPRQPVSDVRPLTAIVAEQTAPRVAQARVLGVFAAIAILLAAVGIHGLLAFAVSQRTPEIGVRVALGARPGDILGMVLFQALWLATAGAAAGVMLGYLAGQALKALLAGVRPADPVTFLAAAGLCLAMTLAGCLAPAWRALRVDPTRAMRSE